MKPLAIGCGVLLLLGVVGLGLAFSKRFELVSWTFGMIQNAVTQALPADLPPEKRQRLDAAFDAARARVESGDLDPAALQRVQALFPELGRQATLDEEDVDRWISELERFSRIGADGEEREAPLNGLAVPQD